MALGNLELTIIGYKESREGLYIGVNYSVTEQLCLVYCEDYGTLLQERINIRVPRIIFFLLAFFNLRDNTIKLCLYTRCGISWV